MNRWRLLAVFLFSMVKKRVIIEAAIKGKVDFPLEIIVSFISIRGKKGAKIP